MIKHTMLRLKPWTRADTETARAMDGITLNVPLTVHQPMRESRSETHGTYDKSCNAWPYKKFYLEIIIQPIPRSSFSETATTVPIGVTTTSRSSTGSEIGDPDSTQPKSRGRPSQSLPTHPSGVAAILKLSRNIRYFPNNDLF